MDSVLILVVMLRYSITSLRNLGANAFLPLDHHIYIHKVIGVLVFAHGWIHSVMHLINFGVNVAPAPVRLIEMNRALWGANASAFGNHSTWSAIGYNLPPGCTVDAECASYLAGGGDPGDMPGEYDCQRCEDGSHPWSYADWMLTLRPGLFGLVAGIACVTGVALLAINTLMTLCSMPFIRRSSHFQVFYVTHLLYYAYFVLLILHAPVFWMCIVAPLVIFVVEKCYLALNIFMGVGRTSILEGHPLASRLHFKNLFHL